MKIIDEKISKALSNEIIKYINNRRDKKEENFLKDKPKKNKQGVITNGAINTRLLSFVKINIEDEKIIATIEKSKKGKEQTALSFQKSKCEQLLSLVEDVVDTKLLDIKNEYHEFLLSNRDFFDPITWLSLYSTKAKDISFATHVGKLTHSSSKSSSILDTSQEKNDAYLTTNSLHNAEIDTASSNAASLPIADILKIMVSGISVLDCVKNNDKSLFENITDNEALVNKWCDQLKQAYDSTQKQSYFLSKQTYFPVKENEYHLLLSLTSSSLVHELHFQHKKYWDEEQDVARKQKNNKKYSVIDTCTYPNKAYLHVTGSKHLNASSLNNDRDGRISLLPAMPPQWQSSIPSYLNKTEVFDKALSFALKTEINELKKYLLLIKNKSLSISEPKRNSAVMRKLQAISGNFFNYIEHVNIQTAMENWTIETHLSIEEQLLFEYCREDEVAMSAKLNKQWMKTLSKSYGRWLNKQLKSNSKSRGKELSLSVIHEAIWADAFLIELREFIAIQEVTL